MRERDKRRLLALVVRIAPLAATITLVVGFLVLILLFLTGHAKLPAR
ncbi:MAG: hypothetical protein ABGY09_07425 [Euryarchaeota archaeon]